MTEPLDPDRTRKAFDALRVRLDALDATVKALTRKADSYSLQLEQTRMTCAAAESQARVCQLDTAATSRLLNEALEQIRLLIREACRENDPVPDGRGDTGGQGGPQDGSDRG